MNIWENLDLKNLPREIWKDIDYLKGLYQISNMGRVKSIEKTIKTSNSFRRYKTRIMRQAMHDTKCLVVRLCFENLSTSKRDQRLYRTHILVAEAFIPNPEKKKTVNHKKGIRTDNRASQLEWNTLTENITHGWKNGLCKNFGVNHCCAKLTEKDVRKIRKDYGKFSYIELSKIFNVSKSSIISIVKRRHWKHIK